MRVTKYNFLVFFVLAFFTKGFSQATAVNEKMDIVFHNTAQMLQAIHFQPKHWNDGFSREIYTSYFTELDPSRKLFLAADTAKLGKFKLHLDDELGGAEPLFFKSINQLYIKRIEEAESIVKETLSKSFSFNTKEVFDTGEEKQLFAANEKERKEKWRKYLKFSTLAQYDELLTQREADSSNHATDAELEKKAREYVEKVELRTLSNIKKLTSPEEAFNSYLNHIINLYDPHSHYYLPVERREFQESMSGVYYGIGALLQEQQGKVKIAELMIGGPAWKSGMIDKDDIIIKVAQGNEPTVDVEGLPMPEIIKLTRGEKGTSVTITFRKKDGTVKAVSMMRDALQLDDNFVKTALIERNGEKWGYIFFPKFYTSFDDKNGRSCAADMAFALENLKKEGISGVLIDIRNNGGGSLGEVINMLGLFIKQGPMVQVKNAHQKPENGGVNNKQVLYDGPLVVMVNELSASASEIFAAAIQDYGRGIVVGNSTYGKGTVQRSLAVPEDLNRITNSGGGELGSLHVTLQKYYRITGAATQIRGVTPDVHLPGVYAPYKMQEKDQPSALAWDTIQPLRFNRLNTTPVTATIAEVNSLLNSDSALLVLKDHLQWIGSRNDEYELTLEGYRGQKKIVSSRLDKVRSMLVSEDSLHVRNIQEVEAAIAQKEEFRKAGNKAFLRGVGKDLYVNRSVMVLATLAANSKLETGRAAINNKAN